jgi:hypothetical protein
MTDLDIKLPLRIVPLEEAVKVVDAGERTVSYTYICDESERRIQTRQFSHCRPSAPLRQIEGLHERRMAGSA